MGGRFESEYPAGFIGICTYGPSKAALGALCAIMAKDLDETGVTVNVLVTDTPMISDEAGFDRGKLIQPEVMVAPLLWLVSDAAAGEVTGRRFLGGPLGSRAASGTSGREGWRAGRLDQYRDDANHSEPLLASLARRYVSERYEV
jgi:NAD(P)-dependent dehydrogenase (short-subunit alcohol dehydrogenase family)